MDTSVQSDTTLATARPIAADQIPELPAEIWSVILEHVIDAMRCSGAVLRGTDFEGQVYVSIYLGNLRLINRTVNALILDLGDRLTRGSRSYLTIYQQQAGEMTSIRYRPEQANLPVMRWDDQDGDFPYHRVFTNRYAPCPERPDFFVVYRITHSVENHDPLRDNTMFHDPTTDYVLVCTQYFAETYGRYQTICPGTNRLLVITNREGFIRSVETQWCCFQSFGCELRDMLGCQMTVYGYGVLHIYQGLSGPASLEDDATSPKSCTITPDRLDRILTIAFGFDLGQLERLAKGDANQEPLSSATQVCLVSTHSSVVWDDVVASCIFPGSRTQTAYYSGTEDHGPIAVGPPDRSTQIIIRQLAPTPGCLPGSRTYERNRTLPQSRRSNNRRGRPNADRSGPKRR